MTVEMLPPYALEVIPDPVLHFTLTRSSTSLKNDRSVMTLCHSGRTKEALAFKVKTTQPRRYLVRPNQGVVMPGGKESVTILIVDKDRQALLDSFDKLGKSALDDSKDKFLVQSCIVDVEFSQRYGSMGESTSLLTDSCVKAGKESVEALTEMWNKAAGGGSTLIYNKKLQVRHVVASSIFTTPGEMVRSTGKENVIESENQSSAPCVETVMPKNDVLNNIPGETKKILNKEVGTCSSMKNNTRVMDTSGDSLIATGHVKGGISFHKMVLVATFFFLIGIKASNIKKFTEILAAIPVFGTFLGIDRKGEVGHEL